MPAIRTETHGPVGVITIDRRSRFNSLDVTTARELRAAGLRFSRDAAIHCVVLRGEGGVFCSGADLKYVRECGDAGDFGYLQPDGAGPRQSYGESFKQILEYLHSTISEIRRAPKPFIAAVDGMAAAGGLGLALACDLVVASERGSFEWAYHKTGLPGAESCTFFLPRLLGLHKAMELVLLNPRLGALEAKHLGLVNLVYPTASFDQDVLRLAEQLATAPPRAFAVTKSLLNQAAGVDRLDYHLDQELQHLVRIADQPEFAEGLAAFFDKRPPRFAESLPKEMV